MWRCAEQHNEQKKYLLRRLTHGRSDGIRQRLLSNTAAQAGGLVVRFSDFFK
jgi:hypothetical protein